MGNAFELFPTKFVKFLSEVEFHHHVVSIISRTVGHWNEIFLEYMVANKMSCKKKLVSGTTHSEASFEKVFVI